MAAFKAKRFVWKAISDMESTISLILSEKAASLRIVSAVLCTMELIAVIYCTA